MKKWYSLHATFSFVSASYLVQANGSWQKDSIGVRGSGLKLTGKKGAWEYGKGEATVNFTLKEEKSDGE